MVDLIAGMTPPHQDRGPDDWIWGCEKSGIFSIKSAYNLICRAESDNEAEKWKCVWKWTGIEADIAWQAGRPGWITLNLDGSVVQRRAAAGGIVRDNEGRGLLAYSMNLGICSITRAELRGALEGIKRAWEAGYQRVEIQSDSKAAIDILIDNSAVISHSHAMEVLEFRDWLRRDWEIKIRHVYREANFAADYLASRGHSLPRGSHYFDLSDSRLAHLIRYDCMGISEPRMILIN
ncbi:Putative ribonuclease H protein At1g65750 [Linum perenne]